jgi:hypothetical protein
MAYLSPIFKFDRLSFKRDKDEDELLILSISLGKNYYPIWFEAILKLLRPIIDNKSSKELRECSVIPVFSKL